MPIVVPIVASAADLPRRVDGIMNPEPILCDRFTTTALDSRLETIIDPYQNNGTAEEYGAILLNRFPPSRPRNQPPSKTEYNQQWQLTCKMPTTKINGCYILNTLQLGPKDQSWIDEQELQSKSANAEVIGAELFMNALIGEKALGYQCESINTKALAGGNGFRQKLKLKQWPTAYGRTVMWRASIVNNNEFLNGTYITISNPGGAMTMQKSAADLMTAVYNHRGASVVWIVVPPSESWKLEARIKSLFGKEIGDHACSQFIKHLKLWIRPSLLYEWGVGYIQVKLDQRQMAIFFPSCYYWGMSTGFSIIEAKPIGSPKWNVESYRFCNVLDDLCKASGVTKFFKISQKDVNAILYLTATGKKRRRPKKERLELKNVLSDIELEMSIDTDDMLFAMDSPSTHLAPPSGGVPVGPLEGNDYQSDYDLCADNEESSVDIDPLVLMDENNFLRVQHEHVQRKYRDATKSHAEAEVKLAKTLERLSALEEEFSKKVPTAAVFQAAAMEANRVILEREREIKELKERLFGADGPTGSEMEVDSGTGTGMGIEGGGRISTD